LGEPCPKCTKNQAREVERFIEYVTENKPELLRAAIQKYVLDAGIDIPVDSRFVKPPTQGDEDLDIPEVEDDENADWAKDLFGGSQKNKETKPSAEQSVSSPIAPSVSTNTPAKIKVETPSIGNANQLGMKKDNLEDKTKS